MNINHNISLACHYIFIGLVLSGLLTGYYSGCEKIVILSLIWCITSLVNVYEKGKIEDEKNKKVL